MNDYKLYLVELYGGEHEPRFINVVAKDEVDAEFKAKLETPVVYPCVSSTLVEVEGYDISVTEQHKSLMGKRVKMKQGIGNDKYGEIMAPDILYVVTKEYDCTYGIFPVIEGYSDAKSIASESERFIVGKDEVYTMKEEI